MDDALRQRAREARDDVRAGRLRGDSLRASILSIPYLEREAWTDAILGIEEPPPDVRDLPRGAVPYLPCGVDDILAMLEAVPLTSGDAFVDLGSGVGRVVLLAHLLTGAPARGIELQGHLVRRARAVAEALALPAAAVSFEHGDAATRTPEGTVYFLYAPFNGPLLVQVLRGLEAVARRRPLVVGAVGFELRAVGWLVARGGSRSALTVYDSAANAGR